MNTRAFWITLCVGLVSVPFAAAQTSATGAIIGSVMDPSNAAIAGAEITVQSSVTNISRKTATDSTGNYTVSLLPPGAYSVTVAAKGFKTQTIPSIVVNVTEVATVKVTLELGQTTETVTVETSASLVQTENATLGRVVGEKAVSNLPLTNRNYTQILGLSPGVAAGVTNAANLGRATGEVNVNGARVMDNSFQMDGADMSTIQTGRGGDVVSASGISIPNPDAIQEFKVQTSLYDASYGRGAGASVNVVTKSGSNNFHGGLWEFLRNDKLNANDFFLNRTGQSRASFKQNQFGGMLGGPVIKDRLFFFFSYQGTRQINGLGSNSLSTAILPPLTNDRSASALGKIFCGKSGQNGGAAVACDGSNINPVALKLVNFKLANGQYIIPSPQIIQPNGLGFSAFSVPSTFTENQYLGNLDYRMTGKQTLSERFFYSRDPEVQSFTAASSTPGFGVTAFFENTNAVLRHTYVITPALLNEATLGFHRIFGTIDSMTPVNSADIGLQSPSVLPQIPTMSITGLFSLGGTLNDGQFTVSQQLAPQEQVSWVHGRHNMRAGFTYEHEWSPFADPAITRGSLTFQSFPDFLLGMSAAQNGTAFSNIFSATGRSGITNRDIRVHNYATYVADDFKVSSRLALNLGLRWEVFGQASDTHGYLVNFWPQIANNDFSSGGTFSGLVAARNFPGTLPDGVRRNGNNTAVMNAAPLGNFGPRFGFAWQPLARSSRLVIRGGYGLYYTRTPINDVFQLIVSPPLVISQINQGVLNAAATFQNPFNPGPPPPSQLPLWTPRNASTQQTISTVAPDWRLPRTHQWALNTQSEILPGWLLQIGYVGSRGERIEQTRSINEAFLASPDRPVNGIITNTLANARSRVPYIGYAPTGLSQREDYGFSTYAATQASLVKRLSRGVQLQASYTFSKAMTSVAGQGGFNLGGGYTNDIRDRRQAWGPADFDRRHRLILNYLWTLPAVHGPRAAQAVLNNWELSGVTVFQSGTPLTITDTRAGSIYGFNTQRAQMCPGATYAAIPTSGDVNSRIDGYMNSSAFCAPPSIGDGFGFGNTGRSIVVGPSQANWDAAFTKRIHAGGLSDQGAVEFRAEFFNAFNTPQFSNPGTNTQAASFGKITSSSVTPRLIQFALKYRF